MRERVGAFDCSTEVVWMKVEASGWCMSQQSEGGTEAQR